MSTYNDTTPIYVGGARLITWSSSPKRGMTVALHLMDIDQYGVHPFKGFVGGPAGQRLMAAVMAKSVEGLIDVGIYTGEAVMFGWSDDSLNGMMVRLLLDSGPDGAAGRHPFDGLRVGRKEGELLAFTAWALSDEDVPIDPKHARKRRPFHELAATQQSQILARDKRFQSWLYVKLEAILPALEVREALPDRSDPVKWSGEVVRRFCRIDSRSVLNKDTMEGEAARVRWRSLVGAYDDDMWGRRD